MSEEEPVNGAHKAEEPKDPLLQGRLYDNLKQLAQIWLPALGTLYFALSGIWGTAVFPAPDKVSGTILAVDTFLGVVLKISSTQYASQQAVQAEQKVAGFLTPTGGVNELSGNPDMQLTFTKDPAELVKHDEVTLKIGSPPSS